MFGLFIMAVVILKTATVIWWMIAEVRAYFAHEAPAE